MRSRASRRIWQDLGLRGLAAARGRLHAEERLRTSYDRLTMTALGPSIRIPVLVVHDRDDRAVPFDDALGLVRSMRDAGLIATSGLGGARLLRDRTLVKEVVRFTATDAAPETAAPTPAARVLATKRIHRPRRADWQAA